MSYTQPPNFPVGFNPYYLPRSQPWAIINERLAHDQSMYALGEYSIFVMLWKITDYQANLCQRCPVCYQPEGAIAQVYKQSDNPKCPVCYGTTFAGNHGGLKALIVRPAMWSTRSTDNMTDQARGVIVSNATQVQSTSDFRLQTGDFIFRADGTRWQIRTPNQDSGETGFEASTDPRTMIAMDYQNVMREDESSVAYLIPPPPVTSMALLDVGPGYPNPAQFLSIQVIDGPLVPLQ